MRGASKRTRYSHHFFFILSHGVVIVVNYSIISSLSPATDMGSMFISRSFYDVLKSIYGYFRLPFTLAPEQGCTLNG